MIFRFVPGNSDVFPQYLHYNQFNEMLLCPLSDNRLKKKKRTIIPMARFNTKNNFLIKLLFKQTL